MKEKILYLIIGVLIGAIVATGVFMMLNKNSGGNRNDGPYRNNGGPIMREGGMPTPEELEGMEMTIMEDGTIRYQSPDGSRTIQHRIEEGPGGSGGKGFSINQ